MPSKVFSTSSCSTTHHALEGVQHVLLLHEAHLAVDLRELRLAVGAQVFVAEAAHDLEVAVVACDHQQLLEGLGALRQRVEGAGVHAGRHHEVAGAFRGGLDQVRGLDLHEALAVQVGADLLRQAVAQRQGALEGRTAQVEVAVLGAQVLAAVALLFDGEGRDGRFVQDADGGELDLDLARGHLGILALALEHLARGLDHEFTAQGSGGLDERGVGVRLHHQLRDAVAVAQVDEGHASEFAGFLHPSRESDCLSFVGETQLAASVGSVHIYSL